MFQVNASLIRFWEKEFSIIQPKKNKKGNRLFTPKDIINFNKIYHLVKIQGYTLDGAKKAIRSKNTETLYSSAETTTSSFDILERLEQIKCKLEALKG